MALMSLNLSRQLKILQNVCNLFVIFQWVANPVSSPVTIWQLPSISESDILKSHETPQTL